MNVKENKTEHFFPVLPIGPIVHWCCQQVAQDLNPFWLLVSLQRRVRLETGVISTRIFIFPFPAET